MGWLERLYWVFAIGGGALFLLRLFFSLIGSVDFANDLPVDLPDDSPLATGIEGSDFTFSLFSLHGLTGFFTMFGLVGLLLLKSDLHPVWTIAGGFGAGAVTLLIISLIILQAGRLQSEGTLDLKNAVGKTGAVYMRIREKGVGQVQISVQGTLRFLDAVTEDGTPMSTGARVRVVGIKDSQTLIVEKI